VVQDVYRILFVRGINTSNAILAIEQEVPATPERQIILDFVRNSSRGLMRGYSKGDE
jgi:UDP-N-acetylglucosamine acyltransferase